MAIYLIL